MSHCGSALQTAHVPEAPLPWTDGTCQTDGQKCRTRLCSLLTSPQDPSWLTEKVSCTNLEERRKRQLEGQFFTSVQSLLRVLSPCFHFCDHSLSSPTFMCSFFYLPNSFYLSLFFYIILLILWLNINPIIIHLPQFYFWQFLPLYA